MLIAIDLGGTKMLSALFDNNLNLKGKKKIQTPLTTDGEVLLQAMTQSIKKLLKEEPDADLEGVAVCVPSPVNSNTGVVLSATNIGIENYPLKAALEKALKVPVIVENDVNAGIYGEYMRGAGRGKRNILGLYPGTGIGGGMILDGELYRGTSGGAAELGHIIVQSNGRICGCGSYGCLETLASKTAIAKDLAHLAAIGKAPSVLDKAGSDYGKIKSSHILNAIMAGEKDVIALVDRAADFLGIGMASCVNFVNPELIILGGGLVEKLGKKFAARAEKSMRAHAMPHLLGDVEVRISELGDDTVILGGALLFQKNAVLQDR